MMNAPESINAQPLTTEQLEQAKRYILKSLPQVLEQSPEFVTFVEGVVAEKFPRRDEFARLLEQVEAHRRETRQYKKETDERFDRIDDRFEAHRRETRQYKKETDERFDRMDDRFDRMDDRFEAHRQETRQYKKETDERFDKIDERFDRMDDRFDRLELTLARLGSRWGLHSENIFRKTMKSVLEESFDATVEERNIQGEQFDLVVMKNGDHILIEIAAGVRRNILERLDRKKNLYISEVGIVPVRIILAVGTINSHSVQIIRDAGIEVIEPDDDFYGEE